ncbi:MAG: dockerin type I domain-containing protein [Planctomycetota bacterium]
MAVRCRLFVCLFVLVAVASTGYGVERTIWITGGDGIVQTTLCACGGTFNPGIGPITAMANIDDTAWIAGDDGVVVVYDYDRTFLRQMDFVIPIRAMTQVGDEVWMTFEGTESLVDRLSLTGQWLDCFVAPVPNGVAGLAAAGPESIWIADSEHPSLVEVDSTGQQVDMCTIPLPIGATIAAMTYHEEVYLPAGDDDAVPVTGASTEPYLWISNTRDSTMLQHALESYTWPGWEPDYTLHTGLDGPVRAMLSRHTATGDWGWGADFNGDGEIDLDDFVILKQNFGRTGALQSQGDADGDGDVDLDDFALLKQNFGAGSAP